MPFEPFAPGNQRGRLAVTALIGLFASAAQGAVSPATGSPSAASATVSSATIAGAVERVDDRDRGFNLAFGTSYAEGDFGAARNTSIVSAPLSVRAKLGSVRLSAAVPYMRIRSDGIIYTGIDSTAVVVAPGATPQQRTAKGLGDLTLGGTYTLSALPGGTELELAGRVKLPTGRSSLTSGRTDYALGVQATRPINRFAPFVSATYRVLGDRRDLSLRDGFAAAAGTSFYAGRGTVVLASYHYGRAATRLVPDSHELFAGASMPLPASRLRLTAYATAGLSQGAAAGSGGLSLSVGF